MYARHYNHWYSVINANENENTMLNRREQKKYTFELYVGKLQLNVMESNVL